MASVVDGMRSVADELKYTGTKTAHCTRKHRMPISTIEQYCVILGSGGSRNFLRGGGGRNAMYQPRRHLSQMHIIRVLFLLCRGALLCSLTTREFQGHVSQIATKGI